MSKNYKLVVFVPLTHCDAVREALGQAGAGHISAYSNCSFSSRGVGRFKGDETTNPFIGQAGELEAVEEERIEVIVAKDKMRQAIKAMSDAHPYEEIAYDIYALVDREEFL